MRKKWICLLYKVSYDITLLQHMNVQYTICVTHFSVWVSLPLGWSQCFSVLIVFAETYPSVPLSVCWWKGVCSQEETNSSAFTQHSGNQLYSCKIETVSSSFCFPPPLSFSPLTLISSLTYLIHFFHQMCVVLKVYDKGKYSGWYCCT